MLRDSRELQRQANHIGLGGPDRNLHPGPQAPIHLDRNFDLLLAREEQVEIPVQVNGRLRARMKVAVGSAEADVVRLALELPAVAQHVNGKRIVKQIYVPDKLLNLVLG